MHEDFKAFSLKPTQKFHNNVINFEKPQKNFKNPKPRSNAWNAWKMKDLDTYQVTRNLIKAENQLRMKFGVREGSLGGEKRRTDQERSSKMKSESCWTLI